MAKRVAFDDGDQVGQDHKLDLIGVGSYVSQPLTL
jgi:hypothetical protein